MEKIRRKPLSEIPTLRTLHENWELWGKEYHAFRATEGQDGQDFSWRNGIYLELRDQLSLMTNGHCSFCDGYPIGSQSKETIEHYYPKAQFPLQAYQWENHYYCCDQCQSESNKLAFQHTLRPDDPAYSFDRFFYYDAQTGEMKVIEDIEDPEIEALATAFLTRYGISTNPKRNQARRNEYKNIRNALANPEDGRIRDEFPYRAVYDYVVQDLEN
jgi:uncharacterized protein (TIGR02646 family)